MFDKECFFVMIVEVCKESFLYCVGDKVFGNVFLEVVYFDCVFLNCNGLLEVFYFFENVGVGMS